MRKIEQSGQFKKDLKRESKGRSRGYLRENFTAIVKMLACDQPLDARFRDHALIGEWKGCRDCHIRPDLVLIYRKPDDQTLELIRLGSHSELGL